MVSVGGDVPLPFVDDSQLPKPKRRRKLPKRTGIITKVEKDLIARVVADQSSEMTERQINALAVVTRRSKALVKKAVEEAHETFVDRSKRYVDIHLQAVEAGLNRGTDKGLEVAQKGSQWAIENISEQGARVIEKQAKDDNAGARIMIGVKIGGIDEAKTAIAVKAQDNGESD
jgi:hypothetical protein